MMTRSFACIALLVITSAAVAGDVPAKASACSACHGQNGVSEVSEWPSLAGQKAGYIELQIKAFRDGARTSPEMAPFIDDLSAQDAVELAVYFAAQAPRAAVSGDAALIERGENLSAYCTGCHGMQGNPIAESWPNLAGQQAAYLYTQLAAFKRNDRINPLMQVAVRYMGDAEFAALAAYYSQLDP